MSTWCDCVMWLVVLFYRLILIGWEKRCDLEQKIVRFVNKLHPWEISRITSHFKMDLISLEYLSWTTTCILNHCDLIQGTYNGIYRGGGACTLDPLPPMATQQNWIVVAAGPNAFQQSLGCGMCLEINGNGVGSGQNPIRGKRNAVIVDLCPECGSMVKFFGCFFSCGIFRPVSDYVNSWFLLRALSLEIRYSNVPRGSILSKFSTFFALDFFYSISKLKSTIDIAELEWTGFVPIESSSLEITGIPNVRREEIIKMKMRRTRTWLLTTSGVVIQRCDIQGFVWSMYGNFTNLLWNT